MADVEGGTREWRSAALPRYARMTRQVEGLIAGAYVGAATGRTVICDQEHRRSTSRAILFRILSRC